MFRTLVKTDALAVEDRMVAVRYFELRTLRGARRYSAEILLGPGDRIILDDDSVTNLEARTTCLVPATLYSRMLARAVAAADEAGRDDPERVDGRRMGVSLGQAHERAQRPTHAAARSSQIPEGNLWEPRPTSGAAPRL